MRDNKEVYKRYYEKAPEIHFLAAEYNTNPWEVVFEWPLEKYDFCINILSRAKTLENQEYKKAQKKAQRGRGK